MMLLFEMLCEHTFLVLLVLKVPNDLSEQSRIFVA
jgi:hypothetical protein